MSTPADAGVQGRLGADDFSLSADEARHHLQTLDGRLGADLQKLRGLQRRHTDKAALLHASQQQQKEVCARWFESKGGGQVTLSRHMNIL